MSLSKKKTIEQKKPSPLVYCGPNLPRGILSQFTTYRGNLPKHLEEHFEKCPALARLFVPPESLSSTLDSIKKPGTAESVWFSQVREYFQGGAK